MSLNFSSAATSMWTEELPLARSCHDFMGPLEPTFLPACRLMRVAAYWRNLVGDDAGMDDRPGRGTTMALRSRVLRVSSQKSKSIELFLSKGRAR